MTGLNDWARALLEGRHYANAQYFGGLLSATPEKWFRPAD